MHFTKNFVTALLATTASASYAAPHEERWALNHLSRNCAYDGSLCSWTFNIITSSGSKQYCKHDVKVRNGHPAPHADGGPTFCGNYRLESKWDHHKGPGKTFTVIGVLDQKKNKIAYFGYDDNEVPNGRKVQPDETQAPEPFPGKFTF